MALRTCRDCGSQVTEQAASCPSCGRPVERLSRAGLVILLLCAVGLIAALSSAVKKPTPSSGETEEWSYTEMVGGASSNGSERELLLSQSSLV